MAMSDFDKKWSGLRVVQFSQVSRIIFSSPSVK